MGRLIALSNKIKVILLCRCTKGNKRGCLNIITGQKNKLQWGKKWKLTIIHGHVGYSASVTSLLINCNRCHIENLIGLCAHSAHSLVLRAVQSCSF